MNRDCDFTNPDETNIPKAVKAASQSDVVIMVLGDCSTSEATNDVRKTCGENNDWATLILPGQTAGIAGSSLCNRKAGDTDSSGRPSL